MNIKDIIKNLKINTFIEIGCHFGTDTEEFRKFHPNARIICFEPDIRNIRMLKERGIDKICELHEVALSDKNGESTFYLSSGDSNGRVSEKILQENDWSCSSSLKKPTGHLNVHPWITFNNEINVETKRLDDIESLKDTIIDFMWVDVQGAEDLVFSGAKETLKRTKYLYTEYSNYPLYENQLNKDLILKLIGPEWVILFDYGGDVLLRNTNFNTLMLTTKLKGGLGNQLFQIAAGETMSKNNGRTYFVESLNTTSAHSNEMYFDSIFKSWKELYKPIQSVIFYEPNFEYKNWLPETESPAICLEGYFQNWRYIPDDFCSRLTFDTSILRKFPIHKRAAFLHVRGGDYKNHWLHDVCLDSYYEQAIQMFPKGTHFYVFTNDIEYAKTKSFLKYIPYSFVFENEVNSLYLMSQCGAGGICANSSYSWWGAYLNPNRKIIMPNKWFNSSNFYTEGYYFPNVIRLSTELDWSFIDKVVYINLDHRKDRDAHMKNMTSCFSNKVVRFSAVQHNPGAIGCTKSHIAVLEMAMRNKWKNVLVLEDDAIWNKLEQGYKSLQKLSSTDYDVIVLGGTFVNRDGNKLISCKSLVAYLVNSTYYDTLIKNFKEGLESLEKTNDVNTSAIDSYWQRLQQKDKWFILTPCLVYQKPDYSDICNSFQDYRNYFQLD